MEEKLNMVLLDKKAEKTQNVNKKEISYYLEFKENDGTMVVIEGDKEEGFTECRIPKNSYYEIYKEYYPNGVLKQKGSLFGESTAIGIWYFFNEQGLLIKEIDEDKKFGAFGYMDVLDFLIKNKYVEKHSYKGIFDVSIYFVKDDLIWSIETMSSDYKINRYILDGNTGAIKEHITFQGGKM